MTLIPELKEYLSKVSPEAKSLLTKVAKKMSMSKAQQRQFLASLQQEDSEWQMAIAPYMPKGATIDPSVFRLVTFPPEAGVPPQGLTLQGVSTRGNTRDIEIPYWDDDGKMYTVSLEPDTVNAIEAVNANAPLQAHEFRHLEGLDGPEDGTLGERHGITYKTGSEDREITNRIQDLMASQNGKELKSNIRSVAGMLYDMNKGRSSRHVYRNFFNATFTPNEEQIIEAAQGLMRSQQVVDLMDMTQPSLWNSIFGGKKSHDVRKDAALGHYFKRKVLGNTDATEMPEDFRKGGRVRLI